MLWANHISNSTPIGDKYVMSGRYQYFLKRKKLYLCIKHNLMRNLIKLLLTHIEKENYCFKIYSFTLLFFGGEI